jgi:hypothetical protein
MEISNKNILLVIMAVCGFLYLSDKFKQPLFQVKLRDSINKTIGNYTSHSVVDWVENKTNSLAAFVSVSSVTILNQLPVSLSFF